MTTGGGRHNILQRSGSNWWHSRHRRQTLYLCNSFYFDFILFLFIFLSSKDIPQYDSIPDATTPPWVTEPSRLTTVVFTDNALQSLYLPPFPHLPSPTPSFLSVSHLSSSFFDIVSDTFLPFLKHFKSVAQLRKTIEDVVLSDIRSVYRKQKCADEISSIILYFHFISLHLVLFYPILFHSNLFLFILFFDEVIVIWFSHGLVEYPVYCRWQLCERGKYTMWKILDSLFSYFFFHFLFYNTSTNYKYKWLMPNYK